MSAPAETRSPLKRWQLRLLLVPIIGLTVAGTLGDWFGAAIINEHPLLQMFINPRSRYLALAANEVDTVPFFVVGFFRLVLTDPLFYILGIHYGDTAVKWIEKKMGDDEGFVQRLVKFFGKASYVIVAVAPNGYICALAGSSGMRPGVFAVLNVGGTMVRLVIIKYTAKAFEGPLDGVMGFIQDYQWWIVGVSMGLGLLQLATRRKKGTSDIESISEIEHELEAADTTDGDR